jgi:cysteine-rich repeat protein
MVWFRSLRQPYRGVGVRPARRFWRRVVLDGAVGLVWASTFVVFTLAPASAGPAVSFSFPEQSGCGPNNVEGWEFQTTTSVTLSALGVYDSQGNGTNHSMPVGVYDAGCTLLASVAIPAGTSAALRNGYRYVGITPVVLAAGQTFRVAAVMHCDDFTPEFNSLANVSLDPSLTGVQTRRIGFGSSLACPTDSSPLFSFGPNFLIGPACGNDVVQAGEECDDGNTDDGDCCSATCQYELEGSPCPGDVEVCTDDLCDATGTCTHPAGNAGAICRPDAGECDVAEQCDGGSPTCPPDAFEENGTACTDDGLYCTGNETCQSGTCTSSGDPCASGICDEPTDQCLEPSPTATPTMPNTATRTTTPTPTLTSAGSVTPTQINSVTATLAPTGSATHTAIGTITLTPTVTSAGSVTPTCTASVTPPTEVTTTPLPTATDTPATVECVGDCDGGGSVAISELITAVNIALGSQPIDRCAAVDSSGNGRVEINELIAAVNRALNGCP